MMKEIEEMQNENEDSNSVIINSDDEYDSHSEKVSGVPVNNIHSPDINDEDEEEEDDGDVDQFDGDALAMQQHLAAMTKQHTQAIIATHGASGGSNELKKMWSQFVQFKKRDGPTF